jgi:DNA-binding CsgD family transcriptional regulator
MSADLDVRTYIRDLQENLQLILFDGTGAATAVVLLVRGALADGDRPKAERLALAAQRLARARAGESDMAAAACHVRGLVQRDSATLEDAAGLYSAPLARASATEDAGLSRAEHGDQQDAVAQFQQAYAQYQELGCDDGMARVRSRLRAAGIRLHHWGRADRPGFGWESLTDTERRIVDLVAQGLSNRQVASQVFLSAHTVAFHLRHVFWKLDVTSRVQLARLAAEHGMRSGAGQPRAAAGS